MIYIVSQKDIYKFFQDYCESLINVGSINLITYKDESELQLNNDDHYIFCQMIPKKLCNATHNHKIYLLNTEQLTAKTWQGKNMPNMVRSMLSSNVPVIDYDLYQSQIFGSNDNYHYIPYQCYSKEDLYLSNLVRKTPKTYDVAFCCVGGSHRRKSIYQALIDRGLKVLDVRGWKNDRDSKIATAKILVNIHHRDDFQIFEHMRCDRWVFAGHVVVSESSLSDSILDIKDLITICDLDSIVDRICSILSEYDQHVSQQQRKLIERKRDLIKGRYDTFLKVMSSLTRSISHDKNTKSTPQDKNMVSSNMRGIGYSGVLQPTLKMTSRVAKIFSSLDKINEGKKLNDSHQKDMRENKIRQRIRSGIVRYASTKKESVRKYLTYLSDLCNDNLNKDSNLVVAIGVDYDSPLVFNEYSKINDIDLIGVDKDSHNSRIYDETAYSMNSHYYPIGYEQYANVHSEICEENRMKRAIDLLIVNMDLYPTIDFTKIMSYYFKYLDTDAIVIIRGHSAKDKVYEHFDTDSSNKSNYSRYISDNNRALVIDRNNHIEDIIIIKSYPDLHRNTNIINVVNCKTSHLNGIYQIQKDRIFKDRYYKKDRNHHIYKYKGEWKIGHVGRQVYYKFRHDDHDKILIYNTIDFEGDDTLPIFTNRPTILDYCNELYPTQIENKSSITFVIPSIGRPSLSTTLKYLINQTDPDWKCIVCYDGVSPKPEISKIIENDPRIRYIITPKKGFTNCAGEVRNDAIAVADTEWVAFVDDDDYLSPDYVRSFREELTTTPDAECVIFRMINQKGTVIPAPSQVDFVLNDVGISFACKTSIINDGLKFVPNPAEDFYLLDAMRKEGHKIVLSNRILYFVEKMIDKDQIIDTIIKSQDCARSVINDVN